MDSWHTAIPYYERRMLIIGSNYRTSNAANRLSLCSLNGATNDTRSLESCFANRGYTVETLTGDKFNKQETLHRVATFLSTALAGDVRAIIFTGHSIKIQSDQRLAIVPPDSADEADTIPAEVWNENIRESTKAGVIVLSIFACCRAGGFAEQNVSLTDFNNPSTSRSNIAASNTPVFITFSSSRPDQDTYESRVSTDGQSDDYDHFLWALAKTARDRNVGDWRTFARRLREHFSNARTIGSYWARESGAASTLEAWRSNHPQTPQFFCSQNLPVRWKCPHFHRFIR